MELILLHFNDFNNPTDYEYLNKFLIQIITIFTSDQFDNYLRVHNRLVENSSKTESRFSKSEQSTREEANVLLIKLNYLKALFFSVITIYSTNIKKFEYEEEHSYIITEIYHNFDLIINMFLEDIKRISLDPDYSVYIISFYLDFKNAQDSLSKLAEMISNNNLYYQKLVKEIQTHFRELTERLNTNIAMNTDIYNIVFLFILFSLLV